MKREEFEIAGAAVFFEFMSRNGASWFFCEAQPRKRNGERGAPIATKFGMRFAFPQSKILNAFEQLSSRLERLGKSRVDLQTRESPSKIGARVILIDDVASNQLDAIRAFWSGPLAIIETSPENYQVFIIAPRGLNSTEYLRAARFLADRFDGDLGACSPGQLHRFPGSPNWRPALVTAGRPFITRLVACYEAEEGFDLRDQLNEMLSGSAAAQERIEVALRANDNSAAAFGWTIQQLKRGIAHDAILAGLQTRWLGHHDRDDWPSRTLHNALQVLGIREARYSAGSINR